MHTPTAVLGISVGLSNSWLPLTIYVFSKAIGKFLEPATGGFPMLKDVMIDTCLLTCPRSDSNWVVFLCEIGLHGPPFSIHSISTSQAL